MLKVSGERKCSRTFPGGDAGDARVHRLNASDVDEATPASDLTIDQVERTCAGLASGVVFALEATNRGTSAHRPANQSRHSDTLDDETSVAAG